MKEQPDIVVVTTLTAVLQKGTFRQGIKPKFGCLQAMDVCNPRDSTGNTFYTLHCPEQSWPGPKRHF